MQQGSSDGNRLTLSARQTIAALADLEVVAHRMLCDEVVDTADYRGAMNGFVVMERRANDDVLAHRAAKQDDVLRNATDIAAEIGSVDLDRPGVGLEQAEQEFVHGALARSHAANDATRCPL